MTLPALRLLEDSGYTPILVGKRWAEDLMDGMGYRFDPIEGHVTEDFARIQYLARNAGDRPLGLLFPNSFSSALLFRIGRIRSTGFPTDARGLLLSYKVPEPPEMHEVERFFNLAHGAIKAWGGTPAYDKCPDTLGLKLLARHEAAARNLIAKYNIPEKFALLAPVARGLHHGRAKLWPYFNALCPVLRSLGIEPIVFPSPREEHLNHQVCPDATILPPTTLGNYAALAKHAQLVVANDSGISHIAAGVGAPQITVMGMTEEHRTYPWNPKAITLGSRAKGWPSVDEVRAVIEEMFKDQK